MNLISVGLELLLAGLLGAALFVGIRLERRLKTLRDSHADFAKAVSELNEAVARADHGLAELKSATREAQTALAERTHDARGISVRLEQQCKIAIDASDRLEAVTQSAILARPPFRSEVERSASRSPVPSPLEGEGQGGGPRGVQDLDVWGDLIAEARVEAGAAPHPGPPPSPLPGLRPDFPQRGKIGGREEEPLVLRTAALARRPADKPALWPRTVPRAPQPEQEKDLGPVRRDEREQGETAHAPARVTTMDERLRSRMGPQPPLPNPRSRARVDDDLFGGPDDEPKRAVGGL